MKMIDATTNSTSVGAVLSTMKRTMVSMPLVPRSMTRLSPPVRRARWKRSDQPVQMLEGLEGQLAHGMLADAGEQDVAELLEAGIDDVADAIGDDQHHRHGDAHHQRFVALRGLAQAVDDALVGEGHERGRDLADHQRADGEDDAQLEVGPARRPHVAPEVASPWRAASPPRSGSRAFLFGCW